MVAKEAHIRIKRSKSLSASHSLVSEALDSMRQLRAKQADSSAVQPIIRATLREHIRLVRRFSTEAAHDWIDRFELSSSEEEVLWLFIARELCAVTRAGVQMVSDGWTSPTSDDVRDLMYDAISAPRAVRELGAQGALRLYNLLQPELLQDGSASRVTLTLGRHVHKELLTLVSYRMMGCLPRGSQTGTATQCGPLWLALGDQTAPP